MKYLEQDVTHLSMYTQIHSKVGTLAQPVPQIWISEAMSQQLNLNKLSDADRSKDGDVRKSQNPNFE